MFWGKKQSAAPAKPEMKKLPGPKPVPEIVGRYLIDKMHTDSVRVWNDMKAVTRPRSEGQTGSDVRVYERLELSDKKVKVHDYNSLDGRADLVLYEGWFDEHSNKVELKDLNTYDYATLNEAQIREKVTGLKEPGETASFYLAEGPATGGPLRHGVAVVELNRDYPGGNHKKYSVHQADVERSQPVGKGEKVFQTNDIPEVVKWIKARHFRPFWYKSLKAK